MLSRRRSEMRVLLDATDISLRDGLVSTFFDAQLPDGSWAGDNYPICDDAPEMDFDYKLLPGGLANAPREPTGSKTSVWFTPEEMSGEFLGEMAVAAKGIRALYDELSETGG